jgi:hypothetical protein
MVLWLRQFRNEESDYRALVEAEVGAVTSPRRHHHLHHLHLQDGPGNALLMGKPALQIVGHSASTVRFCTDLSFHLRASDR